MGAAERQILGWLLGEQTLERAYAQIGSYRDPWHEIGEIGCGVGELSCDVLAPLERLVAAGVVERRQHARGGRVYRAGERAGGAFRQAVNAARPRPYKRERLSPLAADPMYG